MTGPAVSVSGLLALLEAVGARLALDGDSLALTGKRPPVALLEEIKARKPELIAHLRGGVAAREEAAVRASGPPPWEDLAPDASPSPISMGGSGPPLPDWSTLSALPGHCGSCGRFDLAPEWGAFMGTCGCPASAWPDNSAPLAIHCGHRCAAYRGDGEAVGRGYRARASGKRDGARAGPLNTGRQQDVAL